MRDQDILFRALNANLDVTALDHFIQGAKLDQNPTTLTATRMNAWNDLVQAAICKLTQIQKYLVSMESTFGPYTYPQDQRVAAGMEIPCPIDPTHINHLAQPLNTDLV